MKRSRDAADTAEEEETAETGHGEDNGDPAQMQSGEPQKQQQQKKKRAAEATTSSNSCGVAAEESEETAKPSEEVETRAAEVARLQKELAEKQRALETAERALTIAKAQTTAAVEASGHFAMLSDFEILEILRCLVPSSDQARSICAVAATCRRLHALALSPELWRDFDLRTVYNSIKDITLMELCAAPWLSACERLSIDFSSSSSSQIELVERMPNLRELCVSFIDEVGDEDLQRVASALSSLQHLRKLELRGSALDVLREFRLEDSPVESLVLWSCDSFPPIDERVFPRITELKCEHAPFPREPESPPSFLPEDAERVTSAAHAHAGDTYPAYSPPPHAGDTYPAYSPSSPAYTPSSPAYTPTHDYPLESPAYAPVAPLYVPSSLAFAPSSPAGSGSIARAFPNLRKLGADCVDLSAFWKHCHHLEDVDASQDLLPFVDVLAASPCSQTLRRFAACQVDCTELARAAPNLVAVDLRDPTNIAGLAGLVHLQELELQGEIFEELNELGERACGMRLKKLMLLNVGSEQADLTRFFASPCCSQLEVLDVGGFSIDSCIAGLASQSGPLPLRSFKSMRCPSNLSALLAKCPALTDIDLSLTQYFPAGILMSLGATPSIAPVRKFSAPLKSNSDLYALGNLFGRTLQVVGEIDTTYIRQAAIDAFVASCPRLSTIRFCSKSKQLPRVPPWVAVEIRLL